jgi:hypothetical protein
MGQIYMQASRVIAFLGDRPDAHMVPDMLAELKRRCDWSDQALLGEKLFREYHRQENSPRWHAFLNLLEQPYFGRTWVLQEVALAKEVHAIYGNRYIDWAILIELLRLFINEHSAEAQSLLYSAGDNFYYKNRQVSNAPGFASIMTSTQQALQEGGPPPLSTLLQATHGFKVKEPKDKLLALLEISQPPRWGALFMLTALQMSCLFTERLPIASSSRSRAYLYCITLAWEMPKQSRTYLPGYLTGVSIA